MKEDIIIQISNRLKDIRKDKNITLQELADIAGISKGMLSQVENNRTIPSLTVFLNLMKALQIDFNDFFRDINLQPPESKVIFKKKDQNQFFEKEHGNGFNYRRLLSTTVNEYHIDFVLLTLQPGAERLPVSTEAYEFKYLLQGAVKYNIGSEIFDMEAGDSIFFDATEQHHPENNGDVDAVLLVVYIFNEKQ